MQDNKKGKSMYGANLLKLFVLAILVNKPRDKYPKTKLVAVDITIGKKSIFAPELTTSGNNKTILPKMTGMLIKKDNSVALVFFVPLCFKKHMVVPLRDNPGKTAMPCATPHQKAVLYGNVKRLWCCFFVQLLVMSNTKVSAKPIGNKTPPRICGKNNLTTKPITTVGKVATKTNRDFLHSGFFAICHTCFL